MNRFKGATGPCSRAFTERHVAIIVALLAAFAAPVQANESPPVPAHQHGIANLVITVQGQRLAFAFDAPAVNLIGFETAPQSDEQQRVASYAKGQLQQAPRLFITSPGANCRLFSAKVDEPNWDSAVEHHDYRARYIFQCQRPQLLQSIDVRLANQLTPETRLRTEVVVGSARQAVELSVSRTTVRIPL
jgi:Protein of unknown function (DUF2796)